MCCLVPTPNCLPSYPHCALSSDTTVPVLCDGVFAPSLEGDARSLLKGRGVCGFRRLSVAFAPAMPVADGVELCIGTAGPNSPLLQLHRMPALYSLRRDELGLACRGEHGC